MPTTAGLHEIRTCTSTLLKGHAASFIRHLEGTKISVLATIHIKVYEAMLETAVRADAVTFLSTQAQSQIIDPAVPPTRRSLWSGGGGSW